MILISVITMVSISPELQASLVVTYSNGTDGGGRDGVLVTVSGDLSEAGWGTLIHSTSGISCGGTNTCYAGVNFSTTRIGWGSGVGCDKYSPALASNPMIPTTGSYQKTNGLLTSSTSALFGLDMGSGFSTLYVETGKTVMSGTVFLDGWSLSDLGFFSYVDTDIKATNGDILIHLLIESPPAAPQAQAASGITASAFTAKWNASSGTDTYFLDIATDNGFTSFLPGYNNKVLGNVTTCDIAGLDANITYYYRVRGENSIGTSQNSSTMTATTLKLDQTMIFEPLLEAIYGGDPINLDATASSGLTVSYTSSNPSVATITGSTLAVVGAGSSTIVATQDGDATYYPASLEQTLNVLPRDLTISGITILSKEYDGTTDASVTGAVLEGAVSGDDVDLDALTASFASKDAGTGIAVTAGFSLQGVDKDNYSLTQPASLTADITPKELTVSGAAAGSKVYDGTTEASVSGAVLEGAVSGDDVDLDALAASFATKDAGTGIAVTASVSLQGADKDNYNLIQPLGLSADITKAELMVTVMDATRKQGEENPAFVMEYEGFVSGEDESFLISSPQLSTNAGASSIAGDYDITASGGDAVNYSFNYVTGTLTVTSTVGIDGVMNAGEFRIYPNPTVNVLYIKANELSGKIKADLFDITGQKLLTVPVDGSSINISSLQSGIYFLRIEGRTYKIVKK